MANLTNRTIITSVSALALAIVTICIWKLRKRRSIEHSTSNGVSSPSTNLTNTANIDNAGKAERTFIPPEECFDPPKRASTPKSTDGDSFSSVSGDIPSVIEEQIQVKLKANNTQECSPGKQQPQQLSQTSQQVKLQTVDELAQLIQDLKITDTEPSVIDSLKVEYSSSSSAVSTEEIADDLIESEEENVVEPPSFEQADFPSLQTDSEMPITSVKKEEEIVASDVTDSASKVNNKSTIDLVDAQESNMALDGDVSSIDKLGEQLSQKMTLDSSTENSTEKIQSEKKDVNIADTSNGCATDAQDLVAKTNKTNVTPSVWATASTRAAVDAENKTVDSTKLQDSLDSTTVASTSSAKPKKPVRTFSNRRPNQTFAQVLSAKSGVSGAGAAAAATVNNQKNTQSPEMSIDAYQNYPDSPAQNSQCSPMSDQLSDQQSLHSSDSGAGSDSNHINNQRAQPVHDPNAESICYQFDVPAEYCGRLIGSGGRNINSIKSQSLTNCVVTPNSLNPHLKICSIYGSPNNVQIALSLIRQRFPIDEFPEITLSQSLWTNVVPVPTLSLNQSCSLNLLPDINNDAVLTCYIDPSHFFVQQPTHPTNPKLTLLDYHLKMNYSQPNVPAVPRAVPGMICVAPGNGGDWYRVSIDSVSEDGQQCEVMYVDYGGFVSFPVSSLRQIKVEFLSLPFQASQCVLFNIAPVDEINGWSVEANDYFPKLLEINPFFYVRVVEYVDSVALVELFKKNEKNETIWINNELVKKGFAKWVDSARINPEFLNNSN